MNARRKSLSTFIFVICILIARFSCVAFIPRALFTYAMTNLGKIYSEKDGPKWNGPKAIKWFEKAVAKGETWAMGELGCCLLCGECAGKDASRALSLLEKAVAANPDRQDFAEKLERARNEAE